MHITVVCVIASRRLLLLDQVTTMSQLYITKNARTYNQINQIARPYNKKCTLDDVRVQ